MSEPTLITGGVLRKIPLPLPDEGGDKEARGRVLVVGGGRETPGAAVLAGTAALRAGAGKLQVATGASNAALVASALPEARVFALPETRAGKLSKAACAKLEEHLSKAQCVLLGPGLIEDESVARFVEATLRMCVEVPVVLDAGAVACLGGGGRNLLHALEGRAVVTPNADELELIYGGETAGVGGDRLAAARRAADEFRAVVVLKGRETFIASPGGSAYVNRAGSVGLATSGSGDVLAGVIAGLVARGAEAAHAAAWGVYLHALAGERLSRRVGLLGFLARELPAEIPPLMSELSGG
ncbi:MAG: NAD(P)H-hydrate dehydratase [Acidobacteria bacterium]|nr:NAD(P)H-hydrate dehydratase [Acidobacteriota bacterium]